MLRAISQKIRSALYRLNGSIGVKLLTRVLLFSSMISFFMTALQLYSDYSTDMASLRARFHEIEQSQQLSMGESLWALDQRMLIRQMEGLLRLPSVRAVSVRETGQTSNQPLSLTLGQSPTNFPINKDIPLYCCGTQNQKIGILHIEATAADILDNVAHRALVILLTLWAKTFIVASFILYIVHKHVTRHLLIIAKYAQSHPLEDGAQPIRLEQRPKRPKDEIDLVTEALNMRDQRLTMMFQELQQARQEAENENLRYRNLVATMPVGVSAITPDGNVKLYNEAATAIWGRRPEIGKPYFKKSSWTHCDLPASNDTEIWDWFRRLDGTRISLATSPSNIALQGVPCRDLEMTITRPDGSKAYVICNVSPIFSDQGTITGALNVLTDVTELRNVERNLRENASRTRALMDTIPDLTWMKDAQGHFLAANEALTRTLGLASPEAILGKTDLDVSPRELALAYRADDQKIMSTGERRRVDERHFNAEGEPLWIETIKSPVRNEAGEIIGTVGVARDITARRAIEDELRETAQRLDNLIRNLPGTVFRLHYLPDGEKRFLFLAGAFVQQEHLQEVCAWPPERIRAMVHPDDRPIAFEQAARQLKETGYTEHRHRLLHPDGTWHCLQARERLVSMDENGMIAEGISWDITAEVEAAKALRKQEESQRQMERQILELRKVEALGQMAGGIAHDFNNLLGAIQGFASFIVTDAEPSSLVARNAGRILSASKRGKALIEQILTFAHHRPLKKRSFLLSTLLDEVHAELSAMMPMDTLLSVDNRLPQASLEGDREQIGRIIVNLALNARDALPNGQGRISIEVGPMAGSGTPALWRLEHNHERHQAMTIDSWKDDNGDNCAACGAFSPGQDYAAITIRDNGAGMDLSVLRQIFQPFFTTKHKGQGTGLGLSVVHNIVLTHDGALTVRSHLGAGTCFCVILPVSQPQSGETIDVSPREATPRPQPARIMLVEDNMDFGDMLQIALERRGMEVTPCGDAAEALEAFSEFPDAWDILVADQNLPGLSGTELISAVKKSHPDLPCLLCSGNIDSISERTLREAGIDAFLRKPLNMEEFFEIIDKAMAKAKLNQ